MPAAHGSEQSAHDSLDAIYRRLLAGPAADYRQTWQVFAASGRYRAELNSAAARLLRERHLRVDRADDVAHDALLILAECLRRRGDLGFDPSHGQGHFLAWLRKVIRSHCQQALRRQRVREWRGAELDDEWAAQCTPTVPWRAELADAIQSLDEPLRAIVTAFQNHGSLDAVARQLGLSPTTAWRRFRAALQRLQSRCDPFIASGRIVGLPTIIKKW
jgi:RNA polymerase sigma factor (sigma-70 family)